MMPIEPKKTDEEKPVKPAPEPPKAAAPKAAAPKPKAKKETTRLDDVLVEMKEISKGLPALKKENHDEYSVQYGRLLKLAEERDELQRVAAGPDKPRTVKQVESEMAKISKGLPALKKNDPGNYNIQYNNLLALAKERDELKAQEAA